MTVIIDSDVLIEVSRGKHQGIISQWKELSESDVPLLYSPVTAAELWSGARMSEYEAFSTPGSDACVACKVRRVFRKVRK